MTHPAHTHLFGRSCGLLLTTLFALTLLGACGDGAFEADIIEEEDDTVGLSLEGIRSSFDPTYIMSDAAFSGDLYPMDAEAVQALLEDVPHNGVGRSWLADYRIDGRLFSEVLAEGSNRHQVNPLVMLVRLQSEQSMVSKRPPARKIDAAFGCGCHDGQACRAQFRGFENQIECAAKTLRRHYDGSVNGNTSHYVRGRSKRTLDGPVVPSNHATASHYTYTPHIGGRGNVKGAYLTWLIARKYFAWAAAHNPSSNAAGPWVGDTCASADACHADGTCFDAVGGGMCVSTCDGSCPDRPGEATTFCVSLDGGATGSCLARAEQKNNFCQGMPNATRQMATRFVRNSTARVIEREVCMPTATPAPQPTTPDPVTPDPADESTETFVGSACATDTDCNFASGNEIGACIAQQTTPTCSLSCEGYCPDKDGYAPTFCVSLDGGQTGSCLARPSPLNNNCEDRPGMVRVEMSRHIGASGARRASRVVCMPSVPPQG